MGPKIKNVKFLADYPFSIGYGGKEIQLMTYCSEYLQNSKYHGELLDYWSKDSLMECSILHAFGYSTWYRSLFNNLKTKRPDIKVILSPNFYRNDEPFYKLSNWLFSKIPLRNYFSELSTMFSSVDALIFNSDEEREQHRRIFGHNCPTYVIRNGIQDDFTDCGQYNYEVMRKIPKGDYALSVGFFDERKNSIKMLEAFIKTIGQHDLNLILVGEPRFVSESNYQKFLELLNSNSDRIYSLGYVERGSIYLKQLFKGCSFHILPSVFETPGISNLEALAFGKPIVVGECAPVREYFLDGAIYCDPKSIASISDSILQAVQTNKSYKLPSDLYYSSLGKKLIACYDEIVE